MYLTNRLSFTLLLSLISLIFLSIPANADGVGFSIPSGASFDNNGFINFPLPPTNKRIYVSSSSGVDSNPGTKESPVKTLAKARELLSYNGQWKTPTNAWAAILLKAGDEWRDEVYKDWNLCGADINHPFILTSYGTGPRPILAAKGTTFMVLHNRISNVAIDGIEFYNYARDPESPTFGGLLNSGTCIGILNGGENVWLQDCLVHCHAVGIGVAPNYNEGATIKNLNIFRCLFFDNYDKPGPGSEAIFFGGSVINSTIEQCLLDHNGYDERVQGATADMFKHNTYLNYHNFGIAFRENISTRAAATGNMQRCGGQITDNFFALCPIATFVSAKENSYVGGNVIVEGRAMVTGSELFPDGYGTNVPPQQRGWGLASNNAANALFENNIIANMAPEAGTASRAFQFDSINEEKKPQYAAASALDSESNATYRNNIVYNWGVGPALSITIPTWQSLRVYNNYFIRTTPQDVKSLAVFPYTPAAPAITLIGNNHYFDTPTSNSWFKIGRQVSNATYIANLDKTGTLSRVAFPDPNHAKISGHNGYDQAALGGPGSFMHFISLARKQSRSHWDTRLTAATINAWMKAHFYGGGIGSGGSDTDNPTPGNNNTGGNNNNHNNHNQNNNNPQKPIINLAPGGGNSAAIGQRGSTGSQNGSLSGKDNAAENTVSKPAARGGGNSQSGGPGKSVNTGRRDLIPGLERSKQNSRFNDEDSLHFEAQRTVKTDKAINKQTKGSKLSK